MTRINNCITSGSCDEFEDDKDDSDDSDIETLDIEDDDVVSAPTAADSAAAAGSKLRGLPPGITITTVVDSGIPTILSQVLSQVYLLYHLRMLFQ